MLSVDRTINPNRFEQWNANDIAPKSADSTAPPAPLDMTSMESMAEEVRRNPSLDDFILPRQPRTRCNGNAVVRPVENPFTRPSRECKTKGLDSAIVQHYLSQIVELLKKLLEQKGSAQQPQEPSVSQVSDQELGMLIIGIAISLMQQMQPQGTQLAAQFEQTLKGQIIFG